MLTISDTKQLFRLLANANAASPPPPPSHQPSHHQQQHQQCPCFELLSGTGIITESHMRAEIARIIGGQGRTSTFEIAGQLSVEPGVVERLLPPSTATTVPGGWGRVGASAIITSGEFAALRLRLREELSQSVVSAADFRSRYHIDTELFHRLLPSASIATTTTSTASTSTTATTATDDADSHGREWAWLDSNSVYGLQYYQTVKASLVARLRDARAPVDLLLPQADPAGSATIDPPPLALLKKAAAEILQEEGSIRGVVDGTRFVPEAYVAERRRALVDSLHTTGLLSVAAIRREGVGDPVAFVTAHAAGALLLASSHFATPAYISQLSASILDSVATNSWGVVSAKGPEGDELAPGDLKRLWALVARGLPQPHPVIAGVFMSVELEARLKAECRVFARRQADAAWQQRASQRQQQKPGVAPIKRQELSKFLGSVQSLPAAVLVHFTDTLHPYALAQFAERYQEERQAVIDAAKALFADRFIARLHLHLSGLKGIRDPALKAKLQADLQQYARDSGLAALDKLEAVLVAEDPSVNLQSLHQLRAALLQQQAEPDGGLCHLQRALRVLEADNTIPFDSHIVAKKRASMLHELGKQLEPPPKESSLVLLSILLIVLATHSEGILKASGKYVPKLLKEVQTANVVSAPHMSLLQRLKAAALGKSDFSADDMAQLRTLAAQCAAQCPVPGPQGMPPIEDCA